VPRINLSVQHGRTLEEAQGDLETAVPALHSQFGALVRQVTRSADHRRVRLDGVGFWGEMGPMPRTSTPLAISSCGGGGSGAIWPRGSGTSSSRLFSANGPEAAALRGVVRGRREVARLGGGNGGGVQPHGMYAVEDGLSARRRQSSDTG
jgi:hypothetical protein